MPRFAEQVEVAIEALSANVPQPFEENEFIDASRLVYDGVRDIRKAVLMIRVRKTPGQQKLGLTGRCHTGWEGYKSCLEPTLFHNKLEKAGIEANMKQKYLQQKGFVGEEMKVF